MAMSQVSALVLPVVNEPSLATRDWLGNTTKFSYDADGNLTTEAYPNGVSAVSGFDHADLLTSITDKTSSGTLASQAHNSAGELTSATEPTTSKPPVAAANAARGAPRVSLTTTGPTRSCGRPEKTRAMRPEILPGDRPYSSELRMFGR